MQAHSTNTKFPLSQTGIRITGFKSFGKTPVEIQQFAPINIIIGRNNSGKSSIIDLIEECISGKIDIHRYKRVDSKFDFQFRSTLTKQNLMPVFGQNTSGGGVPGSNHWEFGKQFIDDKVWVRCSGKLEPTEFAEAPDFSKIAPAARADYLNRLLRTQISPFSDFKLLRVAAERNVSAEQRIPNLDVSPNGQGTTNLIRAFINNENLPSGAVKRDLLTDLNNIYSGDCAFSEISTQENDNGVWEIFLKEDRKGEVRLSHSGSSLKSIFIALCQLKLIPQTASVNLDSLVFAFEEPENNLHPALLRRLLEFLAQERALRGFCMLISTHSPVIIDWASRRSDCQILHVRNDGCEATVRTATSYLDNRDILDDLDIRASDILQANGVIWVEGPSDRIYLRHWIHLESNGMLKEGEHYAIMFYGGKLLSHLAANTPQTEEDLISLLNLNRNLAVVMDSDRDPSGTSNKKPRPRINATKSRILSEARSTGGIAWVTEGREIENYIKPNILADISDGSFSAEKYTVYTKVIEQPSFSHFGEDKISLARTYAERATPSDLDGCLDLKARVAELCKRIQSWNGG